MGEDLQVLLDPIFLSELSSVGKEDSVVLMTHNGPSESSKQIPSSHPHTHPHTDEP